jgi:hypothetical protein
LDLYFFNLFIFKQFITLLQLDTLAEEDFWEIFRIATKDSGNTEDAPEDEEEEEEEGEMD